MPLDFPPSPTDGQVYDNWVYSTSKGAWQAKPLESDVAVPSPIPPSTPNNGDLWFNSDDGNLYVYYNDGDTSQWVQVKSDATLSSTLGTRVTALEAVPTGLVQLVPTSVSVASGTGSYNTNTGVITFSGATDVRINGVFSAAYTNYKILINSTGASTNMTLSMRMRAAGTDYTTANQVFGVSYWGYPGALANTGSTTSTSMQVGWIEGAATSKNFTSIELANPFTTTYTSFISNSTSYVAANCMGNVPTTTSYDGVTITSASTPTFSGTIEVYGYR